MTELIKHFLRRCLGKKINEHHPDDVHNYEYWLSSQKRQKRIERLDYSPLISIIMPVYNVPIVWLEKAINSIEKQSYNNWELCIVDDASPNMEIQEYLMKRKNEKIKVRLLKTNSHISVASNEALSLANGEFIALLDHDDELVENALYEVVKVLNQDPTLDLVYSDEDKKSLNGRRIYPAFKGGWNPEMLFSFMYVGHLGVYRKKIIDEIGGFRQGFEGAQDFDLILRFTEKTNKIKHLPKVLYHWRMIPGSTAVEVNGKSYAYDRGRLAVFQSLQRRNLPCVNVDEDIKIKGNYIPSFKVLGNPKVLLIVIFNDENEHDTKQVLINFRKKTTYSHCDIIGFHTRNEFNDNDIKCVKYDHGKILESIFSEIISLDAELLSLIGSDIEPKSKDWIDQMIPYAIREEVGGISGKVVSKKHKIQYSGGYYEFNKNGLEIMWADHNEQEDAVGYLGRVRRIQNTTVWFEHALMIRSILIKEYLEERDILYSIDDLSFYLLAKGKLHLYHPFIEFTTNGNYRSNYIISDSTFIDKWKSRVPNKDTLLNPQITYREGKIMLKNRGDFNG